MANLESFAPLFIYMYMKIWRGLSNNPNAHAKVKQFIINIDNKIGKNPKNLGIEPNDILGIIVHILQLLKTYEAAIALIFIYNAYRGLLYSTAAVYIKCNFPARCFGTLMGVFRITMGVFSLINIGLTEILTTYDVEGFNWIVIALGVLVVLTISFPILAIYNKRKPTEKILFKEVTNSQISDETESDNSLWNFSKLQKKCFLWKINDLLHRIELNWIHQDSVVGYLGTTFLSLKNKNVARNEPYLNVFLTRSHPI